MNAPSLFRLPRRKTQRRPGAHARGALTPQTPGTVVFRNVSPGFEAAFNAASDRINAGHAAERPAVPVPVEFADLGLLAKVRDGLRAIPAVYVPDMAADIRDLPGLRAAIKCRALRLHPGCQCAPEDDAEHLAWLASQYADLRPEPAVAA